MKGWHYFSLNIDPLLSGHGVLSFTGQYRGLGAALNADFDSVDRSSVSALAFIFQLSGGGQPDQIVLRFGKWLEWETNIPIPPLMLDLVESAGKDDITLVMDALGANPELEKGLQFLNGVLVRVK